MRESEDFSGLVPMHCQILSVWRKSESVYRRDIWNYKRGCTTWHIEYAHFFVIGATSDQGPVIRSEAEQRERSREGLLRTQPQRTVRALAKGFVSLGLADDLIHRVAHAVQLEFVQNIGHDIRAEGLHLRRGLTADELLEVALLAWARLPVKWTRTPLHGQVKSV